MQSSRSGCSSTTTSPSHGVGTSSRHARLLRQFNEDIFKRHVLTDVEVVVGGKIFKSHRAVLICFSPALKRKLLSADGKPIAKRVSISRINREEFEILLHYMYTGDLKVTCNNFYEIYKAVSVLEMQDVLQECLQILDRPDDIRTYFYIYVTAKKMDVQKNWLRALRLLTHRFEESICDPEFLQIDLHCVVELLSAQSIGARSEVLVFLAALNWLNHDYAGRLEHAIEVMGCVRFSSMSMDEIVACYHPPILPQLLEIPEIVTMLLKATCYVTAKFLGQESGFRQFGCVKRNLAFENLPMELWLKKELPNISSTDFVANWQNSVKSDNNHNFLDSKTDVSSIISHGYKAHRQSTSPIKKSNSLQHTKKDFNKLPQPLKNQCLRGLGKSGESASNLGEAVEKVLEQSARTSRDEINVAEVVKRVLGEINTSADQRKEANPEENRYRLPQDKAKKELKREQSSGMSYFEKMAHMFSNSSEPSAANEKGRDPDFHLQKIPDQHNEAKTVYSDVNHKDNHSSSEKITGKTNLQCISEIRKPRRNQKDTTFTKAKCAKSDTNINLKEGVDNEKRNEYELFTAKSEESRLAKDQTEKSVTNIRLICDPSPVKAELKPLVERSPKQAFFRQKSPLVNIKEEENATSSANLSLESSLQKYERESPCILVTGGMDHNHLGMTGMGVSVLNYDPKEDKWTRYGTLPSPRHNHAAVFWDNCLYIIGGCNPHETLEQKRYAAKRSCHKLHISTSQWSELQDMKFRRYDHGLAVLEGQIYAIGGQDNGDRLLKTMEVYDTKKGKWKVLPSELCCGRKAMGTTIFDGKIWIAGGLMQADKEITQQVISHVDCYDLKQKRWAFNFCSLPSPRCYCSLAVWKDRIYCIGGLLIKSREKMQPTKEVWIYNDKGQNWEEGPCLPEPRMSCATLVYDGLLYAIGGFDHESDVAIRNVNYLSPAAIYWEKAESLPFHLFGIAVTSVS